MGHQPQSPYRAMLSLHDPCVPLDAWGSRKPSWHGVVSVSEAFSTCTYHIPTRLVKQAFSFNTVRSLYSQQQTHGLRLADTTCLFLQHSPHPPNSHPPLQSPASAEVSVYKHGLPEQSISSSNKPLKHAPNSVLAKSVYHWQKLSWKASCLSIFPSSSSVSFHLFIKTMRILDWGSTWMLAWASWVCGKQNPDRKLLESSEADPNTSSLLCPLKQKLIEGLLIGQI